ncbi:hypothetical protein [Tardiphaga sp. 709]|uniref:hypothetical protein n=1 Tax=Tardiphaga sp. 709 TaxID=3076039 RepID=UPI0028F0CCC3|nr:hypothetical protein [Tardiphaga sp. 709]WNV09967.1 hypothetical protein RSO67_01860 [Tardiphaga sp. 709]
MAKAPAEIRSLARSHSDKALNVLVGIMNEKTAPAAARVAAANSIIDRGWGKAPTTLQDIDGNALTVAVVRFADNHSS